jgi:hypothetical protein
MQQILRQLELQFVVRKAEAYTHLLVEKLQTK